MGNCISNENLNLCNNIDFDKNSPRQNYSKKIEVSFERTEPSKAKNSHAKKARGGNIKFDNPEKYIKYSEIYEKNYLSNICKIQKIYKKFKNEKNLRLLRLIKIKNKESKKNLEENKENIKVKNGKITKKIFY
jgi:hypothetical protein